MIAKENISLVYNATDMMYDVIVPCINPGSVKIYGVPVPPNTFIVYIIDNGTRYFLANFTKYKNITEIDIDILKDLIVKYIDHISIEESRIISQASQLNSRLVVNPRINTKTYLEDVIQSHTTYDVLKEIDLKIDKLCDKLIDKKVFTNRDWLNSLSDEDFCKWCLQKETQSDFSSTELNYKQPSPRLETLKFSYTDAFGGLMDWLNSERFVKEDEEDKEKGTE